MNTQDFERLKAVCEKEAIDFFDFLEKTIKNAMDNFLQEKLYSIEKKDPWDRMEFFLGADGIIRKIPDEETLNILKKVKLLEATPSTEATYIEQLKKEAFERFGEIKEGDRFDRSSISLAYTTITVPYNKQFKGAGFKYWENRDSLEFDGVTIYRSGKWATRVKERVDVDFVWSEKKLLGKKMPVVAFHDKGKYGSAEAIVESVFKGKDDLEIANAFRFLAKQLEEYLNKE